LRRKDYEIAAIAPSHGPIYDRPAFIIDAYHDWVSSPPKNLVVIPYVSMHGSTREMVAHLVNALAKRGVKVEQFNLEATDIGKLAAALVDAATIVVGTPAVLGGPHPHAISAAYLANALKPKVKFASVIGSYAWGSRTIEQLAEVISNLKVEILEPVFRKGLPILRLWMTWLITSPQSTKSTTLSDLGCVTDLPTGGGFEFFSFTGVGQRSLVLSLTEAGVTKVPPLP